jgi:hypothetical protein
MIYLLLVLAFVVLVGFAVALRRALRTYFTFRGKRIVSCPETHHAAAVRVAAGEAALEAAVGEPKFHISQCSRWPERQDCPQDCLAQIEEAPKACLVWTIVTQWYQGKECAYCHKPFGEIHWHDHPPALVDADRKTVQWNEIPAENLQDVMRTHLPVCWNCHVAETFRRAHPELVTDRVAH